MIADAFAPLPAGCGGVPRSASSSSVPGPPPSLRVFGSGEDRERATRLAGETFHRRLRERDAAQRFLLLSEAVSWTSTHLLVRFRGRVVSPNDSDSRGRTVEARVLVALSSVGELHVCALGERTRGRLHLGAT